MVTCTRLCLLQFKSCQRYQRYTCHPPVDEDFTMRSTTILPRQLHLAQAEFTVHPDGGTGGLLTTMSTAGLQHRWAIFGCIPVLSLNVGNRLILQPPPSQPQPLLDSCSINCLGNGSSIFFLIPSLVFIFPRTRLCDNLKTT